MDPIEAHTGMSRQPLSAVLVTIICTIIFVALLSVSCITDSPPLQYVEGKIVAKSDDYITIVSTDIKQDREVYTVDKRTRFFIDGREVRLVEIPSKGVRVVMVWQPHQQWWLVEVRVKTR